jgi:hypothetical protein
MIKPIIKQPQYSQAVPQRSDRSSGVCTGERALARAELDELVDVGGDEGGGAVTSASERSE